MAGIDFICSNCGCGSIKHAVEWAPPGTALDRSFAIGSITSVRWTLAARGRRAWRVCLSADACPRGQCKGAYPMLDPRTTGKSREKVAV